VTNSEHGVEFAIYSALACSGVPVPAVHFLELDPAWLERPFFIMDLVPGRPGQFYGTNDPFDGKSAEVSGNFWRHLGTLAAQDPAGLGEAGLRGSDAPGHFWKIEIDHWETTLDRDEDIVEPIVRGAIRWLRANPPPEPAHPSIVHGDYRTGNFLYVPDGSISAVLDWEMCHIGDPLEDIAWALDPLWTMDRYFPLEQGLALWEEASGLTVDRNALDWWRLFTAVKTSALWTTSEKSFEEGENREIVLALTVLRAGHFHRKVILDLMEQRGAMG
jgi:aminoglycoside phosphotransferase (APT) family kinase protein